MVSLISSQSINLSGAARDNPTPVDKAMAHLEAPVFPSPMDTEICPPNKAIISMNRGPL